MTSTRAAETDLTVGSLDDLFVAPEIDPLRGRFDERSGVERLLASVEPSRDPLRIRVTIADGAASRYADADISRAVTGYADARLERLSAELTRIRRLALKELVFGIAFLAFCLLLSGLLADVDLASDWLRAFFVEGIVIIGWIALWHPVDMLFFERLPLIRERRVLHRLRSASVQVLSGAGHG